MPNIEMFGIRQFFLVGNTISTIFIFDMKTPNFDHIFH